MMKTFPHFEPLALEHKSMIESCLDADMPSSDFTFLNRWEWNLGNKTQVSLLHNNVMFQMLDYITDKTIYSFSGKNEVQKTIETALDFASHQDVWELSLIPETTLTATQSTWKEKFQITEDRDQFDYIYTMKDVVAMDEHAYEKKRYKYHKFIRENIFVVKALDVTETAVQNQLILLFKKWESHKKDDHSSEYKREFESLKKCFQLVGLTPLIASGIYIQNELVGFNITELVNKTYCLAHFQKTDIIYAGMAEFLFVYTCQKALEQGCSYINRMQDLGIEGLRKAKEAWKPMGYLKKYRVAGV